jgi:hypothetical protein
MLEKAYGKSALKETKVCEWHKRFRDGRVNVNDDSRCWRPSASTNNANIEGVSIVVRIYRRKRVQ